MRHLQIPEQSRYLRLVLSGFYNYHAVPTNSGSLNAFYCHLPSQ
jgi:RNA-directed DNA polymerase